jgi:hypothetical protein
VAEETQAQGDTTERADEPTLAIGRIVHYVGNVGEVHEWELSAGDGRERPAIVVLKYHPDLYSDTRASILIFLDGSNDPAYRAPGDNSNTLWKPSTPYSADKAPGTWHWPSD